MAKSTDANHDEAAPGDENNQQRLNAKAAARSPGPGAEDRPGFDLGGAVTDTTAGSGLGQGNDASENSGDRRPRPPAEKQARSAPFWWSGCERQVIAAGLSSTVLRSKQ
jgi:hypothetical protein